MTTPTNWPNPERPGYPMFPEQDGWHWLSNRPNETPFPAEWTHEDYSDAKTEWFWDMGEERDEAHEMAGLYYHGPCPFPTAKNETGCVALNNIATLTEQARKNIAVASGARKIAKSVFPILADIDRQVITARNSNPVLTPTQLTELLAGERERCAVISEREFLGSTYPDEQEVYARGRSDAARDIRNIGDTP